MREQQAGSNQANSNQVWRLAAIPLLIAPQADLSRTVQDQISGQIKALLKEGNLEIPESDERQILSSVSHILLSCLERDQDGATHQPVIESVQLSITLGKRKEPFGRVILPSTRWGYFLVQKKAQANSTSLFLDLTLYQE